MRFEPEGGERSMGPGGRQLVARARSQAPAFYRLMLGEWEVTALCDGTVDVPFDALLNGIAPADVQEIYGRCGEQLPAEVSINAYLIHTGNQLVLVDTGAGELFGERGGGELADAIELAGYSVDQIDVVLLTHVHADHSGGLTIDGKRVYQNAVVHVADAEHQHWFSAEDEANAPAHRKHSFPQGRASLAPYIDAGRLKNFSGTTELLPGITAIPAPGHTPGHTLYRLESAGQRLVIWGDIVHSAQVQIPQPSVSIKFDSDEPAAAAQREAVFQQAADEDWLIGAAHISFPGLGKLTRDATGYRWTPVTYSRRGGGVQKGRRRSQAA